MDRDSRLPSWPNTRADLKLLVHSQVRKSPYWSLTNRAGCHTYTVSSNTYHPRSCFSASDGGLLGEHQHVLRGVALWDETPDRQIAIRGRDALAFTDYLVTRDLRDRLGVGRACYALVCDEYGGIVGDPVILRASENELWVSGNVELIHFAKGVKVQSGYDVSVEELDIAPIHLHGQGTPGVMRHLVNSGLLDSEVLDLRRFQLCHTRLDGAPMTIMRMQLLDAPTYEFFPWNSSRSGPRVWQRLINEGAAFDLKVTGPPNIRRLEAGIRFYHSEMSPSTNPFEVGLDWLVQFGQRDFVGRDALEAIHCAGTSRKLTGMKFGGTPITWYNEDPWPVFADGSTLSVGIVTSAFWSPTLSSNIGYSFLPIEHADLGNRLTVRSPDGESRAAAVTGVPFLAPSA